MTNATSVQSFEGRRAIAGLAPIVAVVLFGFLAIGAPLPALSLYVHQTLGFGNLTVGSIIGLQSLVTVSTRNWAGSIVDRRGPRTSVLLGLPAASFAGGLYIVSALAPLQPAERLAILAAGRVVLGLAESLFVTGALTWGIARLGPPRTGIVMSWVGIALYVALGFGAPLGLAVHRAIGFAGVGAVAVATPLIALAVAVALPAEAPMGGGGRVPVGRVLRLIWQPGLVLALATVPFAGMAAFLPLDYAKHGWSGAGTAMAAFGAGYIAVRLIGSHWPQRYGAVRVVVAVLVVEAVGQALLWQAPSAVVGLWGAGLTGVGFSLVFPSMGVIATSRVPVEWRGRAVGNFSSFFDVAIAFTGPVVGVVTGASGYAAAFFVGMLSALGGILLLAVSRRLSG